MFAVEIYAAVRSFVFIKGNSRREAARISEGREQTAGAFELRSHAIDASA